MNIEHSLSRLATAGNGIVNAATGQPVRLRGINRSGLEYSSPEPPGPLLRSGICEREFDELILGWGANIIRLPFTQAWALATEHYDAEIYLSAIDKVIEMASARGAYTLLDLHWLDAVLPKGVDANGIPNFVPALPDERSIQVWEQLGRRYRFNPAVLFDVFNEPHDPLPGDSLLLCGLRRVTMKNWKPWASRLVRAVRSHYPDALVFVSGVNWGFDLRGFPLAGLENVVYSAHVYPNKGRDWAGAFGNLARNAPVFVTEWGGTDTDLDWGRALLRYLDSLCVGWAAWSWVDFPYLVQKTASLTYGATEFGSLVRSALKTELTV